MFHNDKNLKAVNEKLDGYDVISFDLFDTLLFRTVHNPEDVFLTWGRMIKKEYPEYADLPEEAFRAIRLEADRRAREKARSEGLEDITLSKIYDQMHIFGDRRDQIYKLELQAEREHIYLNPSMYSFAKHCHKLGKRLVILSDFYCSTAEVRSFLESAGADVEMFSEILVSSEYGVGKGSGKLFCILLNQFKEVELQRIIHIGDNPYADVLSAQQLGVSTQWYPVVPETNKGAIAIERQRYGEHLGLFSSLRSLAMNTPPEDVDDESKRFWFREGAGVLGPVYSVYAKWVVDTAIRENIRCILPFMRDGELLAEVIRREAASRCVSLKIVPFFISRSAVSLLAKETVSEETIKEYLRRRNLTLKGLFSLFYLNIEETEFADYAERIIGDFDTDERFAFIIDFLLQKTTLQAINNNVNQQREFLFEYFKSIVGEENAITVDLVCGGTIQYGLDNVLKKYGHKYRLIHLILCGDKKNAQLLIDGIELRGCLAYAGEVTSLLNDLLNGVVALEAISAANCGRTISYRSDREKTMPVLERFSASEYELEAKKYAWCGIYWFQQLMFLVNVPIYISEDLRKGLLSVMSRLVSCPLNEETQRIGKMRIDDGYISSAYREIASQEYAQHVIPLERHKYSYHCSRSLRDLWYEAIVERNHPNYYFDEYILRNEVPKKASKQFLECYKLIVSGEDDFGAVGIYGFGRVGKKIAQVFWEHDLIFSAIIDKSIELQGNTAYGVPIIAPEESVGMINTYVVASTVYFEEICAEILQLHEGNSEPKIIGLGE